MKTGCSKVEENLIDFVEKKVSGKLEKEINQHLEGCPHCKRLVKHFDLIWPDFSREQKMPPSPSFWPGLLDKIQRNERPHQVGGNFFGNLKGAFRPIAVVLIFLLGIYFGYYLGNFPQKEESVPETAGMDTPAADKIFFDLYFQDFQDFPQGSVAEFYLRPIIQQKDKTP